MSGPSGVGDTPKPPEDIPGLSKDSGVTSGQIKNALHEKVRTEGQLKDVLISAFGKKEGTKVFNSMMQSIAMLMLAQIRETKAKPPKNP